MKGHYINVAYARPLFGHKPVLGKTYGRIWIKPRTRGNPEHGKLRAPRGVIRIGNVRNPAASQPVIRFQRPPKRHIETHSTLFLCCGTTNTEEEFAVHFLPKKKLVQIQKEK